VKDKGRGEERQRDWREVEGRGRIGNGRRKGGGEERREGMVASS